MESQGYQGVETGPIRPPSESKSLLIRVTRNCPWNKCRFCPVYKGQRFSRRPLEHVLRDVDLVADWVDILTNNSKGAKASQSSAPNGDVTESPLQQLRDSAAAQYSQDSLRALPIAQHWVRAGAKSVFLQDANALATNPADLLKVLKHLGERLPSVERITSYARSQTILKLSEEELRELRAAALNRIHIGFESGSDQVLELMQKGATKAVHVEAGRRVRQAGIELSAYYMPGLGGRKFSVENAIETADLVRQVAPDFLRLRTLAVPDRAPLADDVRTGLFEKATDVENAEELVLFLEHVGDVDCTIVSDHILNLFEDLEGNLSQDREAMIHTLRRFLDLDPQEQRLYRIGRRCGVFRGVDDLTTPHLRAYAEQEYEQLGVTEYNIDQLVDEMVKRFI